MAAPKPAIEPPNPLDIIEAANSFADLAATFRDALVAREFAASPAEVTALQIAASLFAQAPK
ncbi:hypothetical protein SLAY_41 [Microbacterium phage Slay]|nr:hypothetical protein SLAY_41 [Microbacterium phage Slay]